MIHMHVTHTYTHTHTRTHTYAHAALGFVSAMAVGVALLGAQQPALAQDVDDSLTKIAVEVSLCLFTRGMKWA